jgi:nucleoside-diphosphate-sugar epimerase
MKSYINLFGHGFIGKHYSTTFPCIINDRNDLVPKTNEILYFISTTDNYNVHNNPHVDIDTNLTTLIRVLENCRKLQQPATINFASSWFVYGHGDNIDETSHCDPQGFYSITKRTAEQLLISYCKTFNMNYRIMRIANVIGIGDKNASLKKNALTGLLQKIFKGEEVNIYNGGEFNRDYIDVRDTVHAINLVCSGGKLNEIYNIGTGHPTRFIDAINYIVDQTRSQSKINFVDASPFHKIVQTKSFSMNCDKLFQLGFIPKYTVYDTIDTLIEYERVKTL